MSNAARNAPPPTMSVAEFLDWPGDGSAKHYELVDGVVRAMSPASATHGLIQANLAYLIKRCLSDRKSRCRVVTEGAIVPRLRAGMNLRVPDLAVTCAPIAPGQVTVPDPVLIIEILSPSNENATRENVWAYSTIPSVIEIVIVHSTQITVEVFRRHADGSWPEDAELARVGDAVRLESIDLNCALDEVYEGTHLVHGS